MEFFEKIFKMREHNTTPAAEIIAGVTTFMTMVYVLAVNPNILGDAGMDAGAVFTATALSAGIATLCMAFFANLPFGLAAGMGLNSFFAYSVAPKYGWEAALIAVFIEGVIFILLSFVNAREIVFNSIPQTLKSSVSVGIGLFICFIGLKNGGVIVTNPATSVALGSITSLTTMLCIAGLIIMVIMLIKRVKGALFWGILITWLIGVFFQSIGLYVPDPDAGQFSLYPVNSAGEFALFSLPPSIADINLISAFDSARLGDIGILDFIPIVFAFLFVDVFDTIGTLLGVSNKANMLDDSGRLPRLKPALLSDAIGTTVGAFLGTSTVTTYVESAAGVAEGGRTGMTALTIGSLFLLALFLAPVFGAIPGFATASALIVVGLYMTEAIRRIDFTDFEEGFPAFLCIVMMPFSYSVSDGLIFGVLSWVFIKVLCGKSRSVSITMYVIAALFLLKIIWGDYLAGALFASSGY
ncbi:MAG: NCS2 family permease [Spirochaetota bacterium]|nr:NCS2 family permease [Spirochaetota bacterium]